jgi:hypothetical protein
VRSNWQPVAALDFGSNGAKCGTLLNESCVASVVCDRAKRCALQAKRGDNQEADDGTVHGLTITM